jgi:hypothetical protein
MNRKQFIILLVLVAVIGGAGLIIHQRNRESWQSGDAGIGQKLLPNLAINHVAQIRVQAGTNVLELAKHNDVWQVAQRDNYPADFSKISSLLLKLADLKIVQSEQIGPSQLGRFELLPPGAGTNGATLVEFKDESGKTQDTLLLGKPHLQKAPANSQFGGMGGDSWPDGRYVMTKTNSENVAVISDPLDDLQPQPASWLDKTFLSVEKPSAISVQFPEATNDWELTRASETNDWQLADAKPAEKLDSSKLYSVTSPFSSVNFSDVEPLTQAAATNTTVLTVKTFDGFTYVASIGPEQGSDYPVTFKISANLPTVRVAGKDEKPDEKTKLDQAFAAEKTKLTDKLAKETPLTHWTYLLPSYSLDELLKKRADLLEAPKKETTSTDSSDAGNAATNK